MKKMFLLLLICMSSLILNGCWDRVEINDVAIITAAAIDKKENNQIELSVQIFIPRGLSGGGGSEAGGGKLTVVRSGNGVSIADAISKLQGKISRRVFWGHCKVYIFSEEMAKRGIAEEMDFLLRHPQPRERAVMYVSKGRAANILELIPALEKYSAEVIRELSALHIGMLVTMIDLKTMLRGESGAAAIPMIDILPPREGEEKLNTIPYISGTAVFKKDKMIGTLSERTTRGVMWIRDEIQVTTVTVKAKQVKGFVSLNPIRETTQLIPKIEDGKWRMLVRIKTEGDLRTGRIWI